MADNVSGDTNESIRNVKRTYRKKAFQTGYSQKGDAVDSNPLPYSSYSTETSLATTPLRAGVDPGTFKRPVRTSPNNLTLHAQGIDKAAFPWSLVPKSDSSNVIQRQSINITAFNGGNGIDAGEYVDVVVLNNNASGIEGTQTWSGTPLVPTISTLDPDTAPSFPPTTIQSVGGGAFGSGTVAGATGPAQVTRGDAGQTSGRTDAGLFQGVTVAPSTSTQGSSTPQRPNQIFLINRFGHTEATLGGNAEATYQIWVDGELLYQWVNFQWSPVVPYNDMWQFQVPLVVEQQIVFRIINTDTTVGDYLTGTIQAAFVGWSEQFNGYTDVGRQALQGV